MNETIHTGAKVATYGGAGTALTLFGMNMSEVAAIVAAIVALCGLVVQVISTYNRNRRAEELHAVTLEALRANPALVASRSAEDSASD